MMTSGEYALFCGQYGDQQGGIDDLFTSSDSLEKLQDLQKEMDYEWAHIAKGYRVVCFWDSHNKEWVIAK